MISHRADLLDKLNKPVGKTVMLVPYGFGLDVDYRTLTAYKILKEDENNVYLAPNTSPNTYSKKQFLGCRNGYAFFYNTSAKILGKELGLDGKKVGKVLSVDYGIIKTDQGVSINSEDYSYEDDYAGYVGLRKRLSIKTADLLNKIKDKISSTFVVTCLWFARGERLQIMKVSPISKDPTIFERRHFLWATFEKYLGGNYVHGVSLFSEAIKIVDNAIEQSAKEPRILDIKLIKWTRKDDGDIEASIQATVR